MIYFKNEVSKKILKGAKKVYDATKHTLGPNNISSIIYKNDEILIIDDGYTIASSIVLEDEIENIGAKILIEAASQMKYEVGDGTTSTIIMAYSLLKSVLKYKFFGNKIDKVFSEIDNVKDRFILELDKITKKADNINILSNVFYMSFNDEDLKEMISKVLEKIGINGAIDVLENDGETTEVEIEEGYYYYHGFYDESIFEYREIVESNYPVVVFLEEETEYNFIFDLIETKNADIILLVKSLSYEDKRKIVLNNIRKKYKIFVIKLDENKRILHDLIYLTNYNIEKFGRLKKAIITKDLTRFYFDKDVISNYIHLKKEKLKKKQEKYAIYNIERDISNLNMGSAKIKVGGKSELELRLKKYKINDAISSLNIARKYGVILGGGRGILLASKKIQYKKRSEKIFFNSLIKPLKSLIKNCEVERCETKKIFSSREEIVYDFKKKKWENDLYEPVFMVKRSIEIAVSVVKTLSKIDSVIISEKTKTSSVNDRFLEI